MILGLALIVSACASDGLFGRSEVASNDLPPPERPADMTDEVLRLVVNIEAFWTQAAPDVSHEYEPVRLDRIISRSALEAGRGERRCTFLGDAEQLDPDDVVENAYVTFCDEGLTVVYDDIDYVPSLERRYGPAGTAMLMAHEWGHILQDQLGLFNQSSLIAEQQADCWSGAYAAWAESEGVAPFDDATALDQAIISTLDARDEIGVTPDDGESHGNGFDRVRATQEGYDRGVAFCAGYDDTPPPITQIGFLSSIDARSQGNLPYADAVDLLGTEVTDYFESLTDESLEEFVVEPTDAELRDLYDAIGDNAVGTAYALRYAEALQAAEGESVDDEGAALQRACLVGSWLEAVIENGVDDGGGQLSPFDLDESILTLATSEELLDNPGLVFEMVAALRVGTLDGRDACALAG
ncbi:MAG: hypothetical protein ACR2P0_03460 [Acidimicrobiales bacterium]